jgi:transcriptional regulator with XRE-family HTH domain
MRYLNVTGSRIRRLRGLRHWSQRQLAIKLQRCGWDISRATVSKIESRIAEVGDLELLYFAEVFSVNLQELFPKIKVRNRDINDVMNSRF